MISGFLSASGCLGAFTGEGGGPQGGSDSAQDAGPGGAAGADGAVDPGSDPTGSDGADLAGTPAPSDGGAVSAPDLANPGVPFVYVSGYSAQIARYKLDPQTGALTSLGTTPATGGPSFLAFDPQHKFLFALDENGSTVSSFSIDQASGDLKALNTVGSGGSGPAHLSVDPTGKWVLVANYGDGRIASIAIAADGKLSAPVGAQLAGANAHQILTDSTGKYAFVPQLGANRVGQYTFDAATGALGPGTPLTEGIAGGAGPRHLAFHPDGVHVYLINELDSTMVALTRSAGSLTVAQTLSTLPPNTTVAGNTGAEVWVHPSGAALYGSNRGHNSIVRYTLDAAGKMTYADTTPTGGSTPRMFTVDPSGKWLLVANQDSGNVVELAIGAGGALSTTQVKVNAPQPTFVGVVLLPGA